MNFDAVDQHFKCYAHILSLRVQDLLKALKIDQIHCVSNDGDYDGFVEDEKCEESEIDVDERINNLLNSNVNNDIADKKFSLD